MRVTLSKAAENDLEAIGDWIAQENPARARSFIAELRLDCLDLAHFPERNAFYAGSDLGPVRRKVSGNYLIFYVVQKDVISVSRILHGAQDYADLF